MLNPGICACPNKIKREFLGLSLDLETQKKMSEYLSKDEYSLKFELFERSKYFSKFTASSGQESVIIKVDNEESIIIDII